MPDLSSDIERRIPRSIRSQKGAYQRDVFRVFSKAFTVRYSVIFEHSYICKCLWVKFWGKKTPEVPGKRHYACAFFRTLPTMI